MDYVFLAQAVALSVVCSYVITVGIPKLMPYRANESQLRKDGRGALSMLALGLMVVACLALVTQ